MKYSNKVKEPLWLFFLYPVTEGVIANISSWHRWSHKSEHTTSLTLNYSSHLINPVMTQIGSKGQMSRSRGGKKHTLHITVCPKSPLMYLHAPPHKSTRNPETSSSSSPGTPERDSSTVRLEEGGGVLQSNRTSAAVRRQPATLSSGSHTHTHAHTRLRRRRLRSASCRRAHDKKPVTRCTCDGRRPRWVLLLLLRRLISGATCAPRESRIGRL